MKRLSRILFISMVLSLLVVAISPSLVGAASVRPIHVTDREVIYDLNEEDGIVAIGVRRANLYIYPGEPTCVVDRMRHTVNMRVYTWDEVRQRPDELLLKISVNLYLSGEVYTDVWFPVSEEGSLVVDHDVVNGHVVFTWKIKAYSDELPDEILDNLTGYWNLRFVDEVEQPGSIRIGDFPFLDWL